MSFMINAVVKTLFLSLISAFFTLQAIRSQSVDPLLFPKDNYTTETRKVYTAAGEKLVALATSLENHGKEVNARLFWDGGHCADYEPENFIKWIGEITGYTRQ